MTLREFLVSPTGYIPPDKALDGLRASEASQKVAGAAHTVAEIVAHLSYWQDWFYARCTGDPQPMAPSAAAGWPAVQTEAWPALRSHFLDRLSDLAMLGDADVSRRIAPPIEFSPLASYTIGDALIHVATHNAHHLGQVIVLRQLLGAWPPPGGSWTW